MPIIKVIEVLAQSDKSWEDAARQALEEASRTVRNIKSLYVENMQAVFKTDGNGKKPAVEYRVDAKISFEVDGERAGGNKHGVIHATR